MHFIQCNKPAVGNGDVGWRPPLGTWPSHPSLQLCFCSYEPILRNCELWSIFTNVFCRTFVLTKMKVLPKNAVNLVTTHYWSNAASTSNTVPLPRGLSGSHKNLEFEIGLPPPPPRNENSISHPPNVKDIQPCHFHDHCSKWNIPTFILSFSYSKEIIFTKRMQKKNCQGGSPYLSSNKIHVSKYFDFSPSHPGDRAILGAQYLNSSCLFPFKTLNRFPNKYLDIPPFFQSDKQIRICPLDLTVQLLSDYLLSTLYECSKKK